MPDRRRPRPPAEPLTPAVFEILLALTDADRHGYSIMRAVEHRSGGTVTLHAATLYRALNRLLRDGLVEELEERPDPEADDERRRYYRITPGGRAAAAAEAVRMEGLVRAARSRRLLKRATP